MASSAAPGSLEVVREFVNTVEIEEGADPLVEDGTLPQWCAQTGYCPSVSREALGELRAFREALRAILEANAGEGAPTERWRALERFAGRVCYSMYVTPEGRLALRPSGEG